MYSGYTVYKYCLITLDSIFVTYTTIIYIPGIRDKTITVLKLCVTRNCHVRPVFSPKYIRNTQKNAYVTRKLSVSLKYK